MERLEYESDRFLEELEAVAKCEAPGEQRSCAMENVQRVQEFISVVLVALRRFRARYEERVRDEAFEWSEPEVAALGSLLNEKVLLRTSFCVYFNRFRDAVLLSHNYRLMRVQWIYRIPPSVPGFFLCARKEREARRARLTWLRECGYAEECDERLERFYAS